MNYRLLPSMRTIVADVPLERAKVDKILAESQSRVASYLDIRYADSQDVIFLLGGKAVKAGRFHAQGREILTVNEAMQKLRTAKQGSIGFYEISKLLMIVIMGTFMFEPTHAGLKAKLINFQSLLNLFTRKRFTGYLELLDQSRLNYLTFFEGTPREGYFAHDATPEEMEFPVKLITQMVENSDERSEINVYESVGENELHADAGQRAPKPQAEEAPVGEEERDQFTAEILDLCLVAIYEEFFRIMAEVSTRHLTSAEVDVMFTECFEQARYKHSALFRNVDKRDDGSLLSGGLVNFEHLLKAKNAFPYKEREVELVKGMNDLVWFRLTAMKKKLPGPLFTQGLAELNDKLAASRKNYQGNFTIIKFLYELSRLLEKAQGEAAA
ncbi:MAG: hypothetical protein AB1439_08480 [candidate division FCPU426 bacterium]